PRGERRRLERAPGDDVSVRRILLTPAGVRRGGADAAEPVAAASRRSEQVRAIERLRGEEQGLDDGGRRGVIQAREVLEARREPAAEARSPRQGPGAVLELGLDEELEPALGG